MPEEQIALIRPVIVGVIAEKIPVHVYTLCNELKSLYPEYSWSKSTLHPILISRLGITFRDRTSAHYDLMKEDPINVARRNSYIDYFLKYEEEGRNFVFMDESWLNQNMVPTHFWSDGKLL